MNKDCSEDTYTKGGKKPGDYRLGFSRGKGNGDATGMLGIISERTSDTGEELRAVFRYSQKASDRVKWIELTHILKIRGGDWSERRFISKFCIDQSVQYN
jgi:hypothetical protein